LGGGSIILNSAQKSLDLGDYKKNPCDIYLTEFTSLNKSIEYLLKERSGSESSIKNHKFYVMHFAKYALRTPDELVEMAKDQLEKSIKEFLYQYKNKKTASSILQTIKTFFRKNGRGDLEYPQFYIPSRTEIKTLPISLEHAYKMVRFAPSPQVRFMILLLISSGLRVSTALALRFGVIETNDPYLRDYTILKEIDKKVENIVIIVFPKMKELVKNACKCNIPYFVFMSRDAVLALKDYMTSMAGVIENDDVLFPKIDKKRTYKKVPMSTNAVNKMLKKIARKAEIPHWERITVKSFRALFENLIKDQAKEVGLEKEDREFLMGHVLPKPVENYYCPDKIEKLRKIYRGLRFNPEFDGEIYTDLKHVTDFFNISYEKVLEETKLRYGEKPEKLLLQRTLLEFIQEKKQQKIIGIDEIECHLEKGYRYINSINEDMVIVEIDYATIKLNEFEEDEQL
jgi:integrase